MKKNKFIKLTFLIILIIILILLCIKLFNTFLNKTKCEEDYLDFANKNEKTIFSIDKCVFFSNCNAINKENSGTNFTIDNLYQYTDIALFINNDSKENTLENTLKKVKICNLNYITKPELGNPKIFYKNINSFAESKLLNDNSFDKELIFNISSNNNEDLNTPTLYNNCANPIVLSYINENIKNNYTIPDSLAPITYDGSLLKKCGVLLNSLNCKFSFDIYITNNLDQEFKCTVFIEPPLQYKEKDLYSGSISLTKPLNCNFYRYK